MNEHTPRLWKSGLFCLLTCVAIGLMYFDALVWPMAAAAILSLALAALSSITLVWDKHIQAIYAETERVKAYAELAPEQWNAIGIAIPTIRHVWHGLPMKLWDDTMAQVAHMEHFIDTSNAQYTCSERDWTGGDYPRWAWNECKNWLVENGFVIDKSANGNRSFRWYPGKYAEILAAKTNEYYKAHPIPNLNELDLLPTPLSGVGEAENA